MKISTALYALAISAFFGALPAKASDNVGVTHVTVSSPERGTDIVATVWYPSKQGDKPQLLGDSAFFKGTPALEDAEFADGTFPLILLSHGAGLAGNPEAISWIAAPLAASGFIVAAPRHPGNSGKDRSAEETMKLWLRSGDISRTLDRLEREPRFSAHLDLDKIGTLGLSMGGGTALALAGARLDPKLLAAYCDTDVLNASLCGWVRLSGVDLHNINMEGANRDQRDERISFAMAIDPAPVDVFYRSSFLRIGIPVDLVNLGQAGAIPLTLDASAAARDMAKARYFIIPDATHFSMFAECKPGAAELALSEDIDDPICADGGGRSRREIHDQMIAMVIAAFTRALKPAH